MQFFFIQVSCLSRPGLLPARSFLAPSSSRADPPSADLQAADCPPRLRLPQSPHVQGLNGSSLTCPATSVSGFWFPRHYNREVYIQQAVWQEVWTASLAVDFGPFGPVMEWPYALIWACLLITKGEGESPRFLLAALFSDSLPSCGSSRKGLVLPERGPGSL